MSTPHIWTPGMAGPLDEFVARITRMVASFAQEHGLEQAEVRIELFDGSRHVLAAATPEPGFGFFSFVPYAQVGDEPKRIIVPVGAVRTIEISEPDPARPFGFAIDP
jgi:hypothetical protein